MSVGARLFLVSVLFTSTAVAQEQPAASQPTATRPTATEPSSYLDTRRWALDRRRVRREREREMLHLSRRYASAVTRSERKEIIDELYSLQDPDGLEALVVLLSDDSLELRRAAATIISIRHVVSEDVLRELMEVILSDPSDDIRRIAVGALAGAPSKWILRRLLRALGSSDTRTAGWAAMALGELRDYAAVAPLISRLFVRVRVPAEVKERDGGASYIAGWDVFISRGAVAYQPRIEKRGGSRKVVRSYRTVSAPNYDSREALIKITGQDFGFDRNAWRAWWNEYGEDLLDRQRRLREKGPSVPSKPLEGKP